SGGELYNKTLVVEVSNSVSTPIYLGETPRTAAVDLARAARETSLIDGVTHAACAVPARGGELRSLVELRGRHAPPPPLSRVAACPDALPGRAASNL
ncbi:hypothetical protein LSAT2_009800, partial [Lamellibrachia satsuma]